MGATTTRAQTISKIRTGCSFRCLTCMGGQRMIGMMDDNPLPVTAGVFHRFFNSSDAGHSWSQSVEHSTSDWLIEAGACCSISQDVVLFGSSGFNAGFGMDELALICRTNDGGLTFASVVTQAVLDHYDDPEINRFLPIGNNEILAFGNLFISTGGPPWVEDHVLISTDGGETFDLPGISIPRLDDSDQIFDFGGAARNADATVILAVSAYDGSGSDTFGAKVYRSTDRGRSWTLTELPVPEGATFANSWGIEWMGDDRFIIAADIEDEPWVYVTTDGGLNWTHHRVLDASGFSQLSHTHTVTWCGGDVVVAAIWCDPDDSASAWALSTDGGQTWTMTTMGTAQSPTTVADIKQSVLNALGEVVTGLNRGISGPAGEIWITSPTGDTVFEGGACFQEFGSEEPEPPGLPGNESHHEIGIVFGRRLVVSEIEYEYRWETNAQDFGGVGARHLIIEVQGRTTDGREGDIARIEVQNPEPDMGGVTPLSTPLVEAVLIDWASFAPLDTDFDHYDVEVGFSGQGPLLTHVFRRAKEHNNVIVPTKVPIFYRIVPHDAFGPGIPTDIFFATPGGAS